MLTEERPSFLGRAGAPASVRYNNPGAQYPGPSARKHGTIGTKTIGGGHLIAVFDDAIDGAAALFDLMDRGYTGRTVRAAIAKWSGGNHVSSYLAVLERRGQIDPDTMITKAKLRDPEWGVRFAKAMAWHEAGEDYPLSDDDWRRAHAQAFFDVVDTPVTREEARKVVKKTSKKWSVSSFFKWVFTFFGGGAATWEGFRATSDNATEAAGLVGQAVTNWGVPAIVLLCIAGAAAFIWMQERQVTDMQEGRYAPSGLEEYDDA